MACAISRRALRKDTGATRECRPIITPGRMLRSRNAFTGTGVRSAV